MRKITSKVLILVLSLPFVLLSSCSKGASESNYSVVKVPDNNGNTYEIFPIAFADSNKDGKGDLKGIIDKFDYIKSLNYNGIWLTPVHKSSSYHKYDVDDYKSIDSAFGTLDDYDALVKKCHDNDMKIYLDLVLNHTSTSHIWFEKCMAAHIRNQTSDQYYNYYNVKSYNGNVPSGWAKYGSYNLIYECQFYSGMPDLNLQSVLDEGDGALARDLKDIFTFWLKTHNIDGFRLDAVTSYFSGDPDKNLQFLTWLNTNVKRIKPSAYVVGEASWGSNGENNRYLTSGIESCFNFEDSQGGGFIANCVNLQDATMVPYTINKNISSLPENGIAAPFLNNHDLGRVTGYVAGRGNSGNVKFANGVMSILNGMTFSYYGDEIGMALKADLGGTTTKVKDEDKRQPILWGDNYTCKPVSGSTTATDSEKYPFGSVSDQDKDESSILNYVRKANKIRNSFLPIARGTVKTIYTDDYEEMCAISKTYNKEVVGIVINASKTKTKKYNFTDTDFSSIAATLTTTGYIEQPDKNIKEITVPPQGIAIIK
jgi:glycosidase